MYTVLFDVGNVLINFDHRVISRRLVRHAADARQTNTLHDELHEFIFGSATQTSRTTEIDRGSRDLSTLREDLANAFELDLSQSEFEDIWTSIFSDELNAAAIDCMTRLHDDGLNITVCSNTNPVHWYALLDMQPRLRELTKGIHCFLSHEIGKQKADPGFFDLIAENTTSERDHHLLIDDLEENCRAAESAGMHAVVFKPNDPGESIQQVYDFLQTHQWVQPRD